MDSHNTEVSNNEDDAGYFHLTAAEEKENQIHVAFAARLIFFIYQFFINNLAFDNQFYICHVIAKLKTLFTSIMEIIWKF